MKHFSSPLSATVSAFALAGVCFLGRSAVGEVHVPADDPNINYYGRFDMSNPAAPMYNWSAATIEAAFTGTTIAVGLNDGTFDYDIEIDGAFHSVVVTQPGVLRYTVSTTLSDGPHTIRVIQRNEDHWAMPMFTGFYLADGEQVLPAPAKPERKIEFIGDSHLAAYGTESPSRVCTGADYRTYCNANKSFGRLVSRAFHAQDIVLGWTGAGLVHNHGDPNPMSSEPYPTHYGATLGGWGGAWNFSQWVPDLVVIVLGTNDYSTTPNADQTTFVNAYHSFLGTVLGNYPDAAVMCVGTHVGPVDGLIQQVVAAETTSLGHDNVFYGAYPATVALTGCDWHPGVNDHRLIARSLIPTIMAAMGWDTASAGALTPRARRVARAGFAVEPLGPDNHCVLISSASRPAPPGVSILAVNGRMVERVLFDRNGSFLWNASHVARGVYFVGSAGTGWIRVVTAESPSLRAP